MHLTHLRRASPPEADKRPMTRPPRLSGSRPACHARHERAGGGQAALRFGLKCFLSRQDAAPTPYSEHCWMNLISG
jgi:hypothetical protein